MKKIALIVSLIGLSFALASCQNEASANIKTTFSTEENTLSTTSVTINLDIEDTQNEITGNINVRLYDNQNILVSSQNKTFLSVEEATLLVYTGLLPDVTYKVIVSVTVGRDSVEVGTYTFKTLSLSTLEIRTAEDFLAMGQNRAGEYVLQNDIDFDGVEFVTPFTSAFTGSFDGQGFTLSNISITASRLYNGVFGYVSNGRIQNVVLDNIQIGSEENPISTSSSTKTGILAGYQTSTLSTFEDITIKNSNIYLNSSASTYVTVGGVVGEVRGNVFNVTVENSKIELTSTSNGNVRLGGAYGYIFESARTYQHDIDMDVKYRLESATTTRVNRSYNISIGGFAGDVDPASVNNGIIKDIIHQGMITVDRLDFNPVALDKATYTVLVGGLFGNLNRGIKDVITYNSIVVNYVGFDVEAEISQTLRVNGISPVYNSFNTPERVVLVGGTLVLNFPLDVKTQINDGLTKFVIDALSAYEKTVNEESVTETNIEFIDTLDQYFESEYVNSRLEE
jgi:hypothetical protein